MSETALMRAIRKAVNLDGRVRLVRNQVGVDQQTHVRYGLGVGSADLVGIIIGPGRVFALEIKTATGSPTKEQRAWIQAVRRHGGFACIVRSVPAALAAVDRAVAGASE